MKPLLALCLACVAACGSNEFFDGPPRMLLHLGGGNRNSDDTIELFVSAGCQCSQVGSASHSRGCAPSDAPIAMISFEADGGGETIPLQLTSSAQCGESPTIQFTNTVAMHGSCTITLTPVASNVAYVRGHVQPSQVCVFGTELGAHDCFNP
jgi:hypothetical protein